MKLTAINMSSESAEPEDTFFLIFSILVFLSPLVYFWIRNLLLHVLKCVMRSRNHAHRGHGDGLDIEDPSSPQFRNSGLESSAVRSLPMHQFKVNEGGEHKQINTDCAICLGEFEEGEWLKHLPNCSHGFHVPCVDEWFRSHSSCPLCRTSLSVLS
ncbi:hypothetical protein AHAS_Ahas13G0042700 [Arachis hypogaea]